MNLVVKHMTRVTSPMSASNGTEKPSKKPHFDDQVKINSLGVFSQFFCIHPR